MTNYDIERIEKFMDKFELSMNRIFSLLGVGVCESGILACKINNKQYMDLFKQMDDYIFNDLLENGGFCNDSLL